MRTCLSRMSERLALKYGNNPHQGQACVHAAPKLPFKVLNGTPGYINLLDALNAWQLVSELATATGFPAAASFKHVSPAGAAVATPLSEELAGVYEVKGKSLSALATAYVRSRNADPKSSFGDFVALSETVDQSTADIFRIEVSDGVIAPGYSSEALEILQKKKGGKYIVLQIDPSFVPPKVERREIFGVTFEQERNDAKITPELFSKIVTENETVDASAIRDLIVASVAAKYTQSNSVVYAVDGQVIGVGAGQQSRVDCVRLAGQKVETWYLRQHPNVTTLKFLPTVNRVSRVNARVRYIEGDFSETEYKEWVSQFEAAPAPLTIEEKTEFMKTLDRVALCSDAFFPFRDNIDQAAKRGVKFISQPGGSVQDESVIAACNQHGITMAFTDLRLFHH